METISHARSRANKSNDNGTALRREDDMTDAHLSISSYARLEDRVPSPALIRRVEVLSLLAAGFYSIEEAMRLMNLGRSTVYKLLNVFREQGAEVVSSTAVRTSNARAYEADFRSEILGIIKQEYSDYGPQLIMEHLAEDRGVILSRETIRQWMLGDGIWIADRAARRLIHRPRQRMLRFGDLVQIDGSDHDWFEGRAERCTAMVFVDDATGHTRVSMFASEDKDAYFSSTYQYIATFGRPLRFYTDKHTAVHVRGGKTDWQTSMDRLNIAHSTANSPQGKGRVERKHRTLQDRLVKAFRRAGIRTIEDANRYLPTFLAEFNERFDKPPTLPDDAHRRIEPPMVLDRAMSIVEKRRVTRQMGFSYEGAQYVIKATRREASTIGSQVIVERRVDGRLAVYGKVGLLDVVKI